VEPASSGTGLPVFNHRRQDLESWLTTNCPRSARPQWHMSTGEFAILSGSSLIAHCEPHFHESYIVAYLRTGNARVQRRDRGFFWKSGQVFAATPYEFVSGGVLSETLEYDVATRASGSWPRPSVCVRAIIGHCRA